MSTIIGYTAIQSGDGATPGLFNSRMSQLQLNINTLNSAKLENVTTADIVNGAVTNAKLAENAVTNSKVLTGTLQGLKLNANSLDWSSNISINKLSLKDGNTKFKLYFDAGELRYGYSYGGTTADAVLITPRLRHSILWSAAPTSSVSVGSTGEISANSQYVFVCVSGSSWKRAALAGW